MKISIDPMPVLKAAAEQKIEDHFNRLAIANTHKSQEHHRKRDIAHRVLSEGAHVAPLSFSAEADLAGVAVEELAKQIVAKPDDFLARCFERRKAILAVRAAMNSDDIAKAVSSIPGG